MTVNYPWQVLVEKGVCEKGMLWIDEGSHWRFYHYIAESKENSKRKGRKIYTLDGDFLIESIDRRNRKMWASPAPNKIKVRYIV